MSHLLLAAEPASAPSVTEIFPEVSPFTPLSLHTISGRGSVLHLILRRVSPMFNSEPPSPLNASHMGACEKAQRNHPGTRSGGRSCVSERATEPSLEQAPDSFGSGRRPSASSTASLFNFPSEGKLEAERLSPFE